MRGLVGLVLVLGLLTGAQAQGVPDLPGAPPLDDPTAAPDENETEPENETGPAPDDGNATAAPEGNATAPPSAEDAAAGPSTDPPAETPPAPANATAGDGRGPLVESSGPRDPPRRAPSRDYPAARYAVLPDAFPDPEGSASASPGADAIPPLVEASAPPARDDAVPLLLVGAAALATAAATRSRRFGGWFLALFSRIASSAALASGARERLHATVAAHPGIRFRELSRLTGLADGVLTHHLRVLERTRHVVARRDAGIVRYYVAGSAPREGPVLDAATEGLLALLRREGPLRPAEAAARLTVDRREVHRRVEKLERLGLVERRREPRAVYLVARAS